MSKHRSYLSIHIYTFRYDCCVHCNGTISSFFVWQASQNWQTSKCPDLSLLSSVSSRHVMLHMVAYPDRSRMILL